MPYRALLWTMVTVGLALLVVTLWVRAVEPLLVGAEGAAAQVSGTQGAARHDGAAVPPEKGLKRLVQGTLLLSFLLICLLLVVGLAGAFREWVRYRTGEGRRVRKGGKTKYVDAWKIAGERMKPEEGRQEGGE